MFEALPASLTAAPSPARAIASALLLHAVLIGVAVTNTASPGMSAPQVARDTIRLDLGIVEERPETATPLAPVPLMPAAPSLPPKTPLRRSHHRCCTCHSPVTELEYRERPHGFVALVISPNRGGRATSAPHGSPSRVPSWVATCGCEWVCGGRVCGREEREDPRALSAGAYDGPRSVHPVGASGPAWRPFQAGTEKW
jgi:hypothetical protein